MQTYGQATHLGFLQLQTMGKVSDIVIDYFFQRDVVRVPPRGRQTSAHSGSQ